MTYIEADNGSVIITGETVAEVYEASQNIIKRCGPVFFSFTNPVRQADNRFVSRGNVILGEAI